MGLGIHKSESCASLQTSWSPGPQYAQELPKGKHVSIPEFLCYLQIWTGPTLDQLGASLTES